MQIQKRLSVLLLSLLLWCFVGAAAYAHEVPDTSRTGSISVAMTYNGTAVSGGSLSLYQVGAVAEDDGNYSFSPTGDFAGCGKSLDNLESSGLAENLAEYASAKKLEGKTVKLGADGTVTAKKLTLGLYLVVQKEAAPGYEAVAPFLISVPMEENGAYIYDVNAAPKVSVLTKTKPEPTKPGNPKLPQTGQLNWPVPVMAALGMCLFAAGWTMRSKGKEDDA